MLLRYFVLALALCSVSCVSVREFEEIRDEMGPESYIRVDGHQIYVEARGSGEPVLFIHGFGASTYSWRDVIPAVSRGYRTIALDLYGFGYTERPEDLTKYSRSGQIDLIRGVLDALDLESVHVVAHSYGGAIAMAMAHQYPERVRSLVLVDATSPDYPTRRRRPFVEVPGAGWVFLRGLALREPFVEWLMRKSYERVEIIDQEHIDAYRDRIRVEGIARAYRGLTWPRNDDADLVEIPFHEIQQPTLVLWGEDDPLISTEEGRAATQLFPNARFISLPDCGHSPQEEQPEKFRELVLGFLAGLTTR